MDARPVAWEGVGRARAPAFSDVPYLGIHYATDTANHEAPIVFYINLKIVTKNIAFSALQVVGGIVLLLQRIRILIKSSER